jgi:hypothetical protein
VSLEGELDPVVCPRCRGRGTVFSALPFLWLSCAVAAPIVVGTLLWPPKRGRDGFNALVVVVIGVLALGAFIRKAVFSMEGWRRACDYCAGTGTFEE